MTSSTLARALRTLALIAMAQLHLTHTGVAWAQPWAPDQETARNGRQATAAEAQALETLRREVTTPGQRRRYLNAAHALLERFWAPRQPVRLLLAGEQASGCGAPVVQHPMAFYCPESREIGLAMNLRRSLRAARGRSDQELLLLELAILAHEWGHHINREQGLGPYRGGLGLTVRQEELAADWRTGTLIGWLLRTGTIGVDDFTQTANLLFEMGITSGWLPSTTATPGIASTPLSAAWAARSSWGGGSAAGPWIRPRPSADPSAGRIPGSMRCGGLRSTVKARSPQTCSAVCWGPPAVSGAAASSASAWPCSRARDGLMGATPGGS